MPVLRSNPGKIGYMLTLSRAIRAPRLVLALQKGSTVKDLFDDLPGNKRILDVAFKILSYPGLKLKGKTLSEKQLAQIKINLAKKIIKDRPGILKKLRPFEKITVSWVGKGEAENTLDLWIGTSTIWEKITIPK